MPDRQTRELLVQAYDEMIEQYVVDGYTPFFLNFMFNHISATASQRRDIMIAEVTRVHDILSRHIVRKPRADGWSFLKPIFIGCHDLPVWKHKKTSVQQFLINDGLHYNAVALTR